MSEAKIVHDPRGAVLEVADGAIRLRVQFTPEEVVEVAAELVIASLVPAYGNGVGSEAYIDSVTAAIARKFVENVRRLESGGGG